MSRIVVYRVGSLGDTLVVLPAFHLVRRAFPDAKITLLTSIPVNAKAAPMESVLKNTNLYDDTLRYQTSTRDWAGLNRLRRELRAGRYDCLIYLAKPKGGLLTSLRDYLFFLSCGIRRVIGVPLSARTLRCGPIPGSDLYTSETERQLAALRSLGEIDLQDAAAWDLMLTPEESGEAERLLAEHQLSGPFLAASVGTKNQPNDWEEPNWTELTRRVGNRHPALPLVMFGVREEADYSARILAAWRGPKVNLCGLASPRVSAALLRRAAVMVCHDSGPMHLAATVGTPCVAIFSARNAPGEWFPRGNNHTILYHKTPCWGCQLTNCIEQRKVCILSITVDEVSDAVERQLTRAGLSAVH